MSSELEQVRIVIASGSPIIREGLRRLLESEADLKVLGETSDGAEAVTLVRELKPDILLLDWAIPKYPGLEALRKLSAPADVTAVRAILLIAAAEISQIAEALRLGAKGVVDKDSVTEILQIAKAVRTVMAGKVWVEPEIALDVMNYALTLQSAEDEAREENKFRSLSRRELEVVECLVKGLTNREIEDHLGLSHHTVKNYLFRIFDKLGVSSRVELVLLAAQFGFGGPEDADTAGFAVKKPKSPNLDSGSAAANLDDVFDDREGIGYDGAPPTRSRSRGELPPTRPV